MAVAQNWQYKVVPLKAQVDVWGRLKPDAVQHALDEMGRQGWELVSLLQPYGTRAPTLFFKRPA
jgi:hypothetical protein